MLQSVPIGEAKPRLCEMVEEVRKGATRLITVHDEPAAVLSPVRSQARRLTDEWRERAKARDIRLNRPGQPKLTIAQLIQETRP